MSWTPTDEQVEKAAQVLSWLPNELDRAQARAVLVVVGPHIAATERERIARNIEAEANHDVVRNATLATAARIAREGA